MIDFKGHRIEKDIILLCVRWYLAYPLSYQNLEEMMKEHGVQVDHSNTHRWVQKFTAHLEAAFRNGKKRPVGSGWRMDETYIKVKGQWKYLYRAVDREGQTIDFLLTVHRDKKAALRFLKKAVRHHGLPEKITLDRSEANTAAIEALIEETGHEIEIRQNKYLNNLVKQDHRAVKRIVRPMLGFKSFRSASLTLRGIRVLPRSVLPHTLRTRSLTAAYVVIECRFRYTHHLADFFDRQLFLVIEGYCQLPFVFIQCFGSAAAAAPGSGCSQSSLGALFDEIALGTMSCSMANMFLTES